jgi:hypothetical protein
MNRRSFIYKALAGLAAIPILGKLVNSQPVESYVSIEEADAYFAERLAAQKPKYYAALIEHAEDGLKEVSAKGYHRVPIQEIGEPLNFPTAEEDWGYVTHFAIADTTSKRDENKSHEPFQLNLQSKGSSSKAFSVQAQREAESREEVATYTKS